MKYLAAALVGIGAAALADTLGNESALISMALAGLAGMALGYAWKKGGR